MTDLRQAAQQALEALENIDRAMPFPVAKLAQSAIKEALAQPEQEPDRRSLQAAGTHPAPCARHCESKAYEIEIRSLKSALKQQQQAEPEQEPVAWGVFEGNLHDMFFTQEEAQEMAALKGTHAKVRPLYTAPTQRPWQGLTDDEIKEIVGPWGDTPIKGYTRKMFDKIEVKLREKNQ